MDKKFVEKTIEQKFNFFCFSLLIFRFNNISMEDFLAIERQYLFFSLDEFRNIVTTIDEKSKTFTSQRKVKKSKNAMNNKNEELILIF